jgi:hypothetical protein
MKMNSLIAALIAAPVLGFAAGPMDQPSKEWRDQAVKDADAQYKIDKTACDAYAGNAKDICVAEAKGKENIAKASAEARFDSTPRSREKARMAPADAAFAVAKERCDDKSGTMKDVCVKEANAAHVKAVADAKVDRVTSEANTESHDKTAMARRDATEEKRDADYKVASEKCEVLAGTVKESCVRDAKARFGKM